LYKRFDIKRQVINPKIILFNPNDMSSKAGSNPRAPRVCGAEGIRGKWHHRKWRYGKWHHGKWRHGVREVMSGVHGIESTRRFGIRPRRRCAGAAAIAVASAPLYLPSILLRATLLSHSSHLLLLLSSNVISFYPSR